MQRFQLHNWEVRRVGTLELNSRGFLRLPVVESANTLHLVEFQRHFLPAFLVLELAP